MRNLIFNKDTCQKSDNTENDNEDDTCRDNVRTANRPCRITDLRHALQDKIRRNEIFYSFEIVSLRKSNEFYQGLVRKMDKYSPLFYALTWHEETETADNYLPLNLAENLPRNTLLHLAARGFKRDKVIYILRKALAVGITNIFALRGDSLSENGDFEQAADLVAFVREQFGDTFCICVAGYPQMHPESTSKELDLYYLKAKVGAGADFIITQICFESRVIIDFANDCRKIGIQIPIIPGIFVPMNYKCLESMVRICKLDVPIQMENDLSRMKDNDEAVSKFAIDWMLRIMTDVIKSGISCGFHLFTLNRLLPVAEICRRMKFLEMQLGNISANT